LAALSDSEKGKKHMNALEMYLKNILGILEKDEDDRSEEEKAKLDKASAALDGLTEDAPEDEEPGEKTGDDDEGEDPLAVEGATPVEDDDLKEILADLIDGAKEDDEESPLLDALEDLISELGGY